MLILNLERGGLSDIRELGQVLYDRGLDCSPLRGDKLIDIDRYWIIDKNRIKEISREMFKDVSSYLKRVIFGTLED